MIVLQQQELSLGQGGLGALYLGPGFSEARRLLGTGLLSGGAGQGCCQDDGKDHREAGPGGPEHS